MPFIFGWFLFLSKQFKISITGLHMILWLCLDDVWQLYMSFNVIRSVYALVPPFCLFIYPCVGFGRRHSNFCKIIALIQYEYFVYF
jgi:hypothetical protein